MLTEERRKELVKLVKKSCENAKVSIRNIRRETIDEIKKMEKNKELSEDDRKAAENETQKITDNYVKLIDELTSKKEEELLVL